jgi:hypothetical protein
MRLLRGVFALVVGLAVLAGARGADAQVFLRADELLSRTLVNASRALNGAAPLAESPQLDVMARAQAARMAARGQIYHNPNLASDITASGLPWVRVGENVGVGPDIPAIHAAFLASPHHRANLLFPQYTLIGMGVAPGTGNNSGMLFVAHVFAQVSVPAVPSQQPPISPSASPRTPPVAVDHPEPAPTPAPMTGARSSPAPNAVVGGVVDHSIRL